MLNVVVHRLPELCCVALLVVAGCGAPSGPTDEAARPSDGRDTASVAPAPAAKSIGPDLFAKAMAEPNRITINVHVPYEGELAGTDLAIPFDQISARAEQLPASRTTPLAIYCRSGRMSRIAATTLAQLGYRDIVELDGGMIVWQQTGRVLNWR
ncbi:MULTISPECIES: rhodanese-like domain-containing protein [Mycobacteriaceae]|uniref:rhodanese-like domain-containing protein n=1 Tax=Mycobacteriaceae TaxID=1762 RepID=UPI001CD94AD8|nr:rhodanese-like domain-containing protein [Mycobacterium sp. WUMAC-067]MCA2243410.1 rhodanese-like domain-containing protein [Mycobacterium sp. WUMAC-067]